MEVSVRMEVRRMEDVYLQGEAHEGVLLLPHGALRVHLVLPLLLQHLVAYLASERALQQVTLSISHFML